MNMKRTHDAAESDERPASAPVSAPALGASGASAQAKGKEKGPKRPRVTMAEASTGALRRVAALSAAFVRYYKELNPLTHSEDDWRNFEAALQRELPTSFRITSMGAQRALVQRTFERVFLHDPALRRVELSASLAPAHAHEATHTDETEKEARLLRGEFGEAQTIEVAPPQPVQWYLDGASAYTYPIARNALRRNAKLKQLKRFLAMEDEAGHVSGQELVSLVPGVVLDVQSNHAVLDMCAAPGSKSGQLLEALHRDLAPDAMPQGFVMSNELDVERAYMLTHRLQRLASPCMLVVNYPAQHLPTCYEAPGVPLLFDRVLADVPCSGDGTLRKAPHLAASWDNRHALSLHRLQLDIARRGVELLAPGGRMVYSTCSLNPVENEAVVTALLSEFGEALELVDVRHMVAPLKCRPALTTWTVWESRLGEVHDYNALDNAGKGLLQPTMFAPPVEVLQAQHMERCLRLLPHDNDSGGFFVAVLEKRAATPRDAKEVTEAMLSDEELARLRSDEQLKARLGYPRVFAEAPFVRVNEDLVARLRDEFGAHFGLDAAFAVWAQDQLLVRADSAKALALCAPRVRALLVRSAEGTLFTRAHSLKVVHAGVRVLQNDAQKNKKLAGALGSHVRLTAEGVRFLVPRLTRQCVVLDRGTFEQLLGLEADAALLLEHVRDESVRATLTQCALGPLAVVVRAQAAVRADDVLDSTRYAHELAFPAWKGSASVRLNVSKTELKSLRNLYLSDAYDYDLSA